MKKEEVISKYRDSLFFFVAASGGNGCAVIEKGIEKVIWLRRH